MSNNMDHFPNLKAFLSNEPIDGAISRELFPLLETFFSKLSLSSTPAAPLKRWQDEKIVQTIKEGASVLDLGCGSGGLLKSLIDKKNVKAQGVELDYQKVVECLKKGVQVLQMDISTQMGIFNDKSYDYVIIEETLQTLVNPKEVILKTVRIGKKVIISFPNFGYWRVRLDLLVRGKMPVTSWLPFGWYDTPNIHLFTYSDFCDFAKNNSILVEEGYALVEGQVKPLDEKTNLEAEELLLIIKGAN